MKNSPSTRDLNESLLIGQSLVDHDGDLSSEELRDIVAKENLRLLTPNSSCETKSAEEIHQSLPHRPPMLMLDKVLTLSPKQHATGLKKITGNEYGIKSSQFGFVFPSSFALEALGQLATVCMFHNDEEPEAGENKNGDSGSVALTGIKSLQVQSEVTGPCTLNLSIHVLQFRRNIARIEGHAMIGAKAYVDAQFDLYLSPDSK